ncbi:MAG: PHP domain-containing protein [bacterium]
MSICIATGEYSLLDGAIKVDELIKRASHLSMPAIALTDHC